MTRYCTLVVALLGLALCPLSAEDFVMESSVDLNDDGRQEEITVENLPGGGSFSLTVAGITVEGQFTAMGETADGFQIVDIDKADHYQEVAVHSPGPSDDDEYLIYWYNGTTLQEIGRLARWPEFPGWGFVYVDQWMDFWAKRDKYQLDRATHRLQLVPQELYYVGTEAMVLESFPIYQTREATAVVGKLKTGSQSLVLVCDPSPERFQDHWFLIKSVSGLTGWARYEDIWDKLELPMAD